MKNKTLHNTLSLFRRLNLGALSLLAFLLLSSCSNTSFKSIESSDKLYEEVKIFGDSFNKTLYKAEFNYRENILSGLMLIKCLPGTKSYRLVFMSELGFKYFDFDFSISEKNNFKVHYCIDVLNRKSFINTMKRDFESLLMNYPKTIKKTLSINREDGTIITRYTKKGVNNSYFIRRNEGSISGIERKGLFLIKARIEITKYIESCPTKIHLLNKSKNIEIFLSQIEF